MQRGRALGLQTRLRLILNLAVAGVGSALPAASVATTLNRCFPFFSFALNGLEQAVGRTPSSEQAKVLLSFDLKLIDTFTFFFLVLITLRALVIFVRGAVLSGQGPVVAGSLGHPSWLSSHRIR